ncbi:hypothetical protein G7046_g3482 [Stylonectria norvegica]|nr:hypothetical protein G7046_g3482 [Stylonectria norvegica]
MLLLVILTLSVPVEAATRSFAQWKHFFTAWERILKSYLADACAVEIDTYRNASITAPQVGYHVINCILKEMDEFRKAEMSAASVVLGFAPGLLLTLSPSVADTGMLAFRRPGMAFLLAASTTGVGPLLAAEYLAVKEKMEAPMSQGVSVRLGTARVSWLTSVVSAVEYLVAALAVGNNVALAYQLGVWVVCTWAPAWTFMPGLWSMFALAMHLVGWLTLRLRIKFRSVDDSWQSSKPMPLRWLLSEVTPSAWAPAVKLEEREEGYWFLFLASLLYVGSAVQVLFGTAVLSSLMFLSVRDAAFVVARYIGSALLCKAVLIYELAGMREGPEKVRSVAPEYIGLTPMPEGSRRTSTWSL